MMTKSKLDAYEQKWVAKFQSKSFDLKYISGPRNVIANALSLDPFTRSAHFVYNVQKLQSLFKKPCLSDIPASYIVAFIPLFWHSLCSRTVREI